MGKENSKTIWIDLDNTPHIPFFRPIINELKGRGYNVRLTARDAYGVCDLADYFQLDYLRIGRHYGKSKIMKVLGSFIRAMQLIPAVKDGKPDIAVSHGSRTQLIAATLMGVPSVMIFDYEYARALAAIRPTWIMMPDVIPDGAVPFDQSKVYKYPGIKEDVYVPEFIPDEKLLGKLGISGNELVVTIRPPATEAHYHSHKSEELFESLMENLGSKPELKMVVLPRNKKQEAFISEKWSELVSSGQLVIPDHAVDGLNLIWFSDLVISGGGTMNREAAALGVPVYSIFRGTIGAVDRYLADSGRLVLLEKPEDIESKLVLARRDKNRAASRGDQNPTLTGIVEKIIEAMEAGR
jgi:predicted glycosyltransferase